MSVPAPQDRAPLRYSLHRRPADAATSNEACVWRQQALRPLTSPQLRNPGNLALSFDAACAALAQLPRMFIEPDGAFVWVGDGPPAWQLDGVLYDGGSGLGYVALQGACPADRFRELLDALGGRELPWMIQLAEAAVFVSCEEFLEQLD